MKTVEYILTFILAVYAIFEGLNWKEIGTLKRIFVVLSTLLAIIVGYTSINDELTERKFAGVNTTYGDIKDINGATIPKIQIGVDGAIFISDKQFLMGGGVPLVSVYVKDDKLILSTVIRNREGKPIAVIDKNEWTLYDDNYEFNNDNTAFEIVTKGDRKVFFQIYLEKGIAHLTGVFLDSNGEGVYIHNDSTKPRWSTLQNLNKQTVLDPQNDEPLFKYPRARYLGERIRI